ncbi:MAG TPA: hypothetical protein DCZ95_02140 [Verrucomicrobia bacterium]|nr:MAG: hypothetical protein A2X46_00705 [Lentisphaerae bacterium GWF2_57_35]HBA82871.1 hypothetical protein [Verrucomicrobiota bacterium]
MTKIIAMQDIRTSLAAIADEVEKGTRFIVVRNSKPAFQLTPVESGLSEVLSRPAFTLKEMRARFEADPVTKDEMNASEVDRIIHEVHQKKAK